MDKASTSYSTPRGQIINPFFAVTPVAPMKRRRVVSGRGRKRRRGTSYLHKKPGQRVKRARRARDQPRARRPIRSGKRKRVTSSNAADLSAVYINGGRKLKVAKLVRSNKEYAVLQHTVISPLGGPKGAVQLNYNQTAAGAQLSLPMVIYDLTCCPNTNNATVINPSVYNALIQNNETDTATMQWSSAFNWVTVRNPNPNATGFYPGARSLLEWVNCDLMLYGPLLRPGRFCVGLAQFKDDEMHPSRLGGGTTLTTRAQAELQQVIKPYITNPVQTSGTKVQKPIKWIKRYDFYIDPKETTENVNARTRRVRIFHRFNRRLNYNWYNSDLVRMNDTGDLPASFGDNQAVVHPNARVYLVIMGQACQDYNTGTGVYSVPTAWSANTQPSFDINLKVKHSCLGTSNS